ncbi:methyltransferase domain-containing protein [Albimonas sp. CAU 1670]|uniref:class I SAM-dependent methyltransferase n=1 Tax=Albimonas sp. CAU 1670 TaxID=3032599 RepID=UPI0023DA19F8|nr:class I SAM-dependent methyltransferase [Albimonas sp. CAU 1670]MDF2232345.1 methyltransferase domain-containing protein [Albimonas sp. CAU 1670]
MTSEPRPAFDRSMAERYDERNRPLAPISQALHFLSGLALAGAPEGARVLSVGVGTGAEILALAQARPGWRFVGVDPSAEMLEVCAERLCAAGLAERCTLVQGTVDDAPQGPFDVALAMLVAHFVPDAEREGFYRGIHARLVPGGRYLGAEICADLDAPEFPRMLADWAQVQRLMGASPESLAALPRQLRETLSVLTPERTASHLQAAGFSRPTPFFQAFMIRGVHADA